MAKKKSGKSHSKKSPIRNLWIIIAVMLIAAIASFFLDDIVLKLANITQNNTLFEIFYIFTLMGEWYVFIWIVLFILLIFFVNRKSVVPLIVAVGTSALTMVVLKYIINRPRPFEALNLNSIIITSSSSFPSGHAMMAFSTIPILSKNFPNIKIVFWIIASLIALSRVYFGVHYFSDILFGALLGYLIGWISLKLGEKYGWKY